MEESEVFWRTLPHNALDFFGIRQFDIVYELSHQAKIKSGHMALGENLPLLVVG